MSVNISIVIPVYNEEESILTLLGEISKQKENIQESIEVIVVDDGSQDKTAKVVEDFCEKNKEFRLLRHIRNKGQSAAVLTGVRWAESEWILTLDGDGQNDPKDIPVFIELAKEQVSEVIPILIIGNRLKREDNWLRKISTRVANRVRSFVLQDDCLDSGCGIKMFRRTEILMLPLFDHFHRFLPALIKAAGGRVLNVPVHHRPRMRGISKYGVMNRLWVGIVDILGVLWLRNRSKCWALK